MRQKVLGVIERVGLIVIIVAVALFNDNILLRVIFGIISLGLIVAGVMFLIPYIALRYQLRLRDTAVREAAVARERLGLIQRDAGL